MKGFVKKGLLLLALGVLIAGCAAPAEEDAISSSKDGNIEGIPMILDPANQKLTIGDGSENYKIVQTFDGHSIQMMNGGTGGGSACVSDGAGNSQCWIRLFNRDSDEYMANAFAMYSYCESCTLTNHIMDNFDAANLSAAGDLCWDSVKQEPKVLDACTVHLPATTTFANMGGSTPITTSSTPPYNGGAIAYVSDSFFPELAASPQNPFGAPMHVLQSITTPVKADWMIAPQCGYGSQMWDFGGTDTTQFPFWVTVKAAWFQMNPFGDNGVVGGGNDDPRFDFQNYDTWYLVATDLVSSTLDTTWQKKFRPGSIYRSNVLAGYKPAWAKAAAGWTAGKSTFDLPVSTGVQKYFAVNVGLDAANRLENQVMGLRTNLQYEYYQQIGTLISWNNRVIQHNASAGWLLTKAGGTRFQQKATPLCVVQSGCDDNMNNSSGTDIRFDPAAVATAAAINTPNAGYVGTINKNPMATGGYWSYFNYGESYTYVPMDGTWDEITIGPVDPADVRNIPKSFCIRGFTKIRCMNNHDATCVTQDGPDSDPELWLYQIVFKGQASALNLGTDIKLETHSQYTAEIYRRVIGGLVDQFDSQDPHPTDNTTNAGPFKRDVVTYFNIIDGMTVTVGSNSGTIAFGNKAIRHRGPVKSASHQGWNLSVCIK